MLVYFRNQIASPIPGSKYVELAFAACSLRRLSFKTRAAAYRDECLYWGGISFTTARPLVLAMQLVIRDECLNSEMLDRLTTIIVNPFTDSADLSATGHLEKLTSLLSRQEYCKATLSREHSSSCCTENSLQYLGSLIAHEVYLRSLFGNSTILE